MPRTWPARRRSRSPRPPSTWSRTASATPTYARVDLVRDDTGGFCVLELELVEPSLFLAYAEPAAAERFATVLAR